MTFTAAEYERRWSGVIDGLGAAGFDAIVVTSQVHHHYLTGHDAAGAYAAPYFLIVAPGVERTLVVRLYDEINVRNDLALELDVQTYYGRRQAAIECARALERLGLGGAAIGLELDWWGLAPADVAQLEELLPDARFADGSRVVADVAAVKSDEEIAAMRRAAELTDIAIGAFHGALAPGVSESEATAEIARAVEAAGGTLSDDYTLLFGDRTALPHAHVSDNRLREGALAFIEASGVHLGYCAGLCRTAVIGRHREAEELHAIAEAATEAAIAALRPGALTGDVHAAAFAVVEAAGRGGTFRQRCGYEIGLHWYERGYLSLEPGAREPVAAGMTFHMPRILFDEERRFGVGTSETVVVGENGAERMSRTPGTLALL